MNFSRGLDAWDAEFDTCLINLSVETESNTLTQLHAILMLSAYIYIYGNKTPIRKITMLSTLLYKVEVYVIKLHESITFILPVRWGM